LTGTTGGKDQRDMSDDRMIDAMGIRAPWRSICRAYRVVHEVYGTKENKDDIGTCLLFWHKKLRLLIVDSCWSIKE